MNGMSASLLIVQMPSNLKCVFIVSSYIGSSERHLVEVSRSVKTASTKLCKLML